MDATEREAAEVTAAPAMTADGVAMAGDYPLNHRLRAEALADAGKSTDPDGLIADDLIAATADRLTRERADEPSMAWTRDRLAELAARTPGATFEEGANKRAILDAIKAAPTVSTES